MKSTKETAAQASFMQEMFRNKFMLLTVLLAVVAVVYFVAGLFMLLGH